MGIRVTWDSELPKTPEGLYQVQGGIDYAIAKSLAAAPFADILWMETKTADLADAKQFAEAIHTKFPDKMLAYNLSPSFNWDTTGMSEDEMRRFPEELGKLGFVFNFITYGGHQIDGVVSEEFATALKQEGMLALAKLQRKIRLLESPYRTPQTLVGGPRLDAALMAISGRTAATKAMGKGSTQFQHMVTTEVPPRVLEEWLDAWRAANDHPAKITVQLRPHTAGSELLELSLLNDAREKLANVIFANIQDRRGRTILSIRDQNTVEALRKKRLMTRGAALPHPPVQGRVGALRDADGGQRPADAEHAAARDLQPGQDRGRPDHRRRREHGTSRRTRGPEARRVRGADSEAVGAGSVTSRRTVYGVRRTAR